MTGQTAAIAAYTIALAILLGWAVSLWFRHRAIDRRHKGE